MKLLAMFLLLLNFLIPSSLAQERPEAQEVVAKSQLAFYYPGNDFSARVLMRLIDKEGKERVRELTMLRKNLGQGQDQKYFIYFHRPPDVRGLTFMVWKYPGRDDDRWLFIPAVNLVKRIAANDKRSSFVGSDFSYEDVSGRDLEDDTHAWQKEERLAGREVYVIKSTPKEGASAEYNYKVSWMDKGHLLPLKEEYYDKQGKLYKVFTADEVRVVDGFPTVVKRTMKNVQAGHRTEVTFTEIRYNLGLTENLFSERYLRRPPSQWIK